MTTESSTITKPASLSSDIETEAELLYPGTDTYPSASTFPLSLAIGKFIKSIIAKPIALISSIIKPV